jgi:hypothetical protein
LSAAVSIAERRKNEEIRKSGGRGNGEDGNGRGLEGDGVTDETVESEGVKVKVVWWF